MSMKLIIEQTARCKFCHPETCNCPDYQLLLNDSVVATGDYDSLHKTMKIIEDAVTAERGEN